MQALGSFQLAPSPPWASQFFLSPVRSTSARTPGSSSPTLHSGLPHPTSHNVSRKTHRPGCPGRPCRPPPRQPHFHRDSVPLSMHGYLERSEERCGPQTRQTETGLAALGNTDALELSQLPRPPRPRAAAANGRQATAGRSQLKAPSSSREGGPTSSRAPVSNPVPGGPAAEVGPSNVCLLGLAGVAAC